MNNRRIQPKLEPLEWRHAHDLQRVVNDPTMEEWSNMPHVYFSNGAQSLIQRSLHQASKAGSHMLALYIEDDLSGVFSIQRDSVDASQGNLLFWIESSCWRNGKAIAYLTDVVAFAIADLGLTPLGELRLVTGRGVAGRGALRRGDVERGQLPADVVLRAGVRHLSKERQSQRIGETDTPVDLCVHRAGRIGRHRTGAGR